MSRLKSTQDASIRYDQKTGAIRSFFGVDLVEMPAERGPAEAQEKADKKADGFLDTNRDLFKLDNITLEKTGLQEGSAVQSVQYQQYHHGIPIYGAQLVVGLSKQDGRIISAVNEVDYEIPESLLPDLAHLNTKEVTARVHKQFDHRFKGIKLTPPQLYVYRHALPEFVEPPYGSPPIRQEMLNLGIGKKDQVYLVWQVMMDTREPSGNWELLVDATNGDLVAVKDRRCYATRSGYVFWPDPIASSQNAELNWDTDAAILNRERAEVNVENLGAPVGGKYKLSGTWIKTVEKESPTYPPPETSSDFKYDAKDRSFLNVMAYYYLDRLVSYLRNVGVIAYNNAVTKPLDVDPQGVGGDDNSHFSPSGPYIAYGEGGVPDASDPGVIVHEYGHALHYYLLGSNHSNGSYEEGFNDFLAACWVDRFNDHQFQRENFFRWDNNKHINWGPKRRVNLTERFDDHGFSSYGMYYQGDIFATALWDIFLRIGGNSSSTDVRQAAADTMIHTYMETLVLVRNNRPPEDLANGMITVDQVLTGGQYRVVIEDVFRRWGLWIGTSFSVLRVRSVAAQYLNKYPPISIRTDIYGSDNPQQRTLRQQLAVIQSRH